MIAPLIVTAHFDQASFAALEGLRRRYFPAHLNKVPAHLSLFHKLPGDEIAAVEEAIAEQARVTACLDLRPAKVRFLGRGVALAYQSVELERLRGALAARWRSWLTPQDQQPFRAHVTIQNKAEPATARALYEALSVQPLPPCRIDGITTWRYLGGPWEHVSTLPFDGASDGGVSGRSG